MEYKQYLKFAKKELKKWDCGELSQDFFLDKNIKCNIKLIDDYTFKISVFLDDEFVDFDFCDIKKMPKNENKLKEFCLKTFENYLSENHEIISLYLYMQNIKKN